MLTRLEVDGFKNLVDVELDLGPFTCIAGENAAGKSNLFDAIEFMSLLADNPLMDAAQQVRGVAESRAADPRDLFWSGHELSSPTMRLAVEMIVPESVEDDFGQPANATATLLRYELRIGYARPEPVRKLGRITLLSEELQHINLHDAPSHLRFPHSAKNWRSALVKNKRYGTAFISTETVNGEPQIQVHQDGGSRGRPQAASATRAPATVLSTTTQASDPTILAARREMQTWRRLALEPSAMRTPSAYHDPTQMDTAGRFIAGTLHRVAVMGNERAEDVYARVAARLSSLIGTSIRRVGVAEDDARESLTLVITESSGIELPARSLSEGTLRFLALCVLLEDPTNTGLLSMEEPENGIHPANIPAIVDLLHDLAVDPSEPPGSDNPLRQVLVNTHSPGIVQLVEPQALLFADNWRLPGDSGDRRRAALRLRPMRDTWRAEKSGVRGVGKMDLIDYLTSPVGAQRTFDIPAA